VVVLDPLPPPLRRRGAAAERAAVLGTASGRPDVASELARREIADVDTLRRIGVSFSAVPASVVSAGPWLMSADRADRTSREVLEAVREHERSHPLDQGMVASVLAERLGLPSVDLLAAVVRPPLRLAGGRVVLERAEVLPPELELALDRVAQDLAAAPFAAPTADRLEELGLDDRRQAAAARAGRILRLSPGIVLLPGADRLAVDRLRELPQPFTASEARVRLGSSRRVVLPLLAHLDRTGLTRRLPDDRRQVADQGGSSEGPSPTVE
jgi:selenocysteine-specific elongation factor